jgi:hypothetical protein
VTDMYRSVRIRQSGCDGSSLEMLFHSDSLRLYLGYKFTTFFLFI